MILTRSLRVAAVGAGTLAMSLGLATAPAAAANAATKPATVLPYVCRVGGHAPCWAVTQHSPVYLYGHSGGRTNVTGDLAMITCYYYGTPVVSGDDVEDHVTELRTNAGTYKSVDGHIPDWDMDLHDNNPWQVGIPYCG